MAREKKPVQKVQMTEGKRNIIHQLLEEYDIRAFPILTRRPFPCMPKGMATRQISETIEDIYGFEASKGFISDVTDKILPQIEDWQNQPLGEVYPILYIDAIHYSVRDNGVVQKLAAYVILSINAEGGKKKDPEGAIPQNPLLGSSLLIFYSLFNKN